MLLPQVLSFREFRAGLAATLKQVQEPDAEPVFVGAHRKPEAVVMSVSHYQHLRDRAERREAVEAALASVRAEGLEPSALGHRLLSEVAVGRIGTDEMRSRLTEHYTR
ncbi:type II toxin-antitoxin system Phd/YefM family antitoxin [Pseudonocardia abyssalis]|uniref:Type II toxin-antitoxin system Phd/YefM family antitoxin n=1 Tax=Pseudonocardia abyssalis TaxID=2792008 RepID=A0ABS6UPP5_9PSEU|nr:type II toxin-antitoxin system Phd/YefM family antitoxin [Pseudonocardia abyssalis]MBW0115565.1 type II toxin-antitoxin system Phd/YefM family antitoxin [Pseudonocardia abyssalis]MBW0134205.1 type II toxin-antitoxin system Phd/YefM family antitoxin [Pseudonocardia abyssalis]